MLSRKRIKNEYECFIIRSKHRSPTGKSPRALVFSRCLERVMKDEARVFDMTSQMKQ